MIRHIALCIGATAAVVTIVLPLPATRAHAATPARTHTVAPSIVKQLENSCWGCLHSAVKRATHATQRPQAHPSNKRVERRARPTHTAHLAQRRPRVAHTRHIQ